MASSLETTAASLVTRPEVIAGIGGDPDLLAGLFEVTRAAPAAGDSSEIAVTVYGASAAARAWTGRPSEIPPERILDERAFFVAPGPLGLRLVYVEPVIDPPDGDPAVASPPRLDRRGTGSLPCRWRDGTFRPTPSALRRRSPMLPCGRGTRGPAPSRGRAHSSCGRHPAIGYSRPRCRLQICKSARSAWRRTVLSLVLTFLALLVVLTTLPLINRPARGTPTQQVLSLAGLAAGGFGLAVPSAAFSQHARARAGLRCFGLMYTGRFGCRRCSALQPTFYSLAYSSPGWC